MNGHSDSAKRVKSDADTLRLAGSGAEISAWQTDDRQLHELADEVRRRYSKRLRRTPVSSPAR